MTEIWTLAAVWFALAVLASLVAHKLRVSAPLMEIVIGAASQSILGATVGSGALGADQPWIKFLGGAGMMLLMFLIGAEIDPEVLKLKWKETTLIGIASFAAPFVACAAVAYYFLGWGVMPSWLAGVALGGAAAGIVYAELMQHGLIGGGYGKMLLAASFIADVATIVALALIFVPFSAKTLIFLAVGLGAVLLLPPLTKRLFGAQGGHASEPETRFLFLCLLALGATAAWAGTEAVLPAFFSGVALSRIVGEDQTLLKRLRGATFGLLTPFFFISAGYLVSLQTVVYAPVAFMLLLVVQIAAKVVGVYFVSNSLGYSHRDGMYSALLLSPGLGFGAIASLFGLSHAIIDKSQYSILITTVIVSSVLPVIVAGKYFLPHHLSEREKLEPLTTTDDAPDLC